MTVHYQSLDAKTREFLEAHVRGRYLDGQCYEFALALHRYAGLPIIALEQTAGFGGRRDPVIVHAVAELPPGFAGELIDARGYIYRHQLNEPFGIPEHLRRIREATEEELFAIRMIQDSHIERAARLAEALWPELPWKNSEAAKRIAFLEELEALSRRHGFWLSRGVPGTLIHIREAFGEEKGYELRHTDDGLGFITDRFLG